MTKIEMTRQQVLSWRQNWSFTDQQTIEYHIDRIGITTFYRTEVDDHIRCLQTPLDTPGKIAMSIGPGWIDLRKYPNPNKEGKPSEEWATLSTFRKRHESNPLQNNDDQVCPRCFITLPATGMCDNCD